LVAVGYGKRFTIEETFRDTKNGHLGIGLSATHIRDEGRRDRGARGRAPVTRQTHVAGEKLFVDYSGDKPTRRCGALHRRLDQREA
jgi:hypothetical protein